MIDTISFCSSMDGSGIFNQGNISRDIHEEAIRLSARHTVFLCCFFKVIYSIENINSSGGQLGSIVKESEAKIGSVKKLT